MAGGRLVVDTVGTMISGVVVTAMRTVTRGGMTGGAAHGMTIAGMTVDGMTEVGPVSASWQGSKTCLVLLWLCGAGELPSIPYSLLFPKAPFLNFIVNQVWGRPLRLRISFHLGQPLVESCTLPQNPQHDPLSKIILIAFSIPPGP